MSWHNGSAATCTCDQCQSRRDHPNPDLEVIQGRPQAEIDADTKAMRSEQAMRRRVEAEQQGRGIGPLLFLDWEAPLDPDWARRFGVRL